MHLCKCLPNVALVKAGIGNRYKEKRANITWIQIQLIRDKDLDMINIYKGNCGVWLPDVTLLKAGIGNRYKEKRTNTILRKNATVIIDATEKKFNKYSTNKDASKIKIQLITFRIQRFRHD